jgi:O-antigen/teichoic acid export membrane protein
VHVEGVAGKVLGIALGAVLLVLTVTFSLALFAVLLSGVVLFGGYFWWKTRKLRKQMRKRPPPEHYQRPRPGKS